uniref:Integrase catalytic domain-containing protein n=1 Tax=Salix viminalis TaxID=40686 RepID=A0A6N2LIB7_SALVM
MDFIEGLPTSRGYSVIMSIVSDKDTVFTSSFWKEIFRLSGTKLLMSSAYYPQTNDHTEAMNKWLEGPFEVVFGKAPPRLQPYEPWSSVIQAK